MKRTAIIIALSIITLSSAIEASAFDLKSVLKTAKEKAESGKKDGNNGSSFGSILGNMLSTDNVDITSMTGNWKYISPAVKFKSDNVLKQAGGSVASATVENKLASIYKTAGVTTMTFSAAADSTFIMKVRGITLKGNIENVTDKNSKANFVFKFKAAGKIKVGQLDGYVTKSAGGTMDLTFDVSKLVSMLKKISSVAGNKSLSAASALLSSYDGVCAGFRLEKTK